jgi:hypothetical protein
MKFYYWLKTIINLFSCLILMMPCMLYGRNLGLYEPKSRQAFFGYINSVPMAVVQVYGCRARDCRSQSCQELKAILRQRMLAVSKNQRFVYANIAFVLMDIGSCPELLRDLGLERVPSLLLFVQGAPVKDQGFLAHIDGMVTEIEINQFVDAYLGAQIDDVVNDRVEHDRDVEQARIAAWAAWGPYWFGGYYRPCYSNWGWGCGWGFNGCW